MGTLVFRGIYAIEKHILPEGNIPIFLVKPTNKDKRPVILCSHGFLGNKDSMLQICLKYVDAGFAMVTWDAKNHGERTQPTFWMDCHEDFPKEWMKVVVDSACDVSKIIDFLESREDVIAERIGIMGVSMGGFISVLSATIDKRLRSIVSIIGGANYKALFAKTEFLNFIPFKKTSLKRLHKETRELIMEYEPIDKAERFFPKAILLLNGDLDNIVPRECAEKLYDALKPHYKTALEKLVFKVYKNTYHWFTPEMSENTIEWFRTTL